ncbi:MULTISPECIES: hypothetical protein [Microbacterium]|uniref:hypothetical protein n=1 Tax=Microbacterium TaxID=33882 RepID=UPI0011EB2B3C|nr:MULTISPECIES: hypothetical protein [Microbacterium]
MSNIRAKEILAEALRSAAARPARFLALAVLSILPLAGLILLETAESNTIRTAEEDAVATGAYVLTVTNDGNKFDGSSCARAQDLAMVVRSGVIYETRSATLVDFPTVPLQLAVVSPGLVQVADPNIRYEAVGTYVLGDAVSEELSLQAGSPLRVKGERVGTVGGFDTDTRRAEAQARWMYRVDQRALDRPIVQCWLETAPGQLAELTALVPLLFDGLDTLRASTLASSDALDQVKTRFEQRPSKYGWIALGVLLGMITFISISSRRSEYAIYITSGLARHEVALVTTVEYWVLATFTGAASFCIAVGIQTTFGAPLYSVMEVALQTLLLTLTTGAIVCGSLSAFVWANDLSRALKNRD